MAAGLAMLATGPAGLKAPRLDERPTPEAAIPALQNAVPPTQDRAEAPRVAMPTEPATTATTPEPMGRDRPRPDINIPNQSATTAEPFGTPTAAVTGGGMFRKWKGIQDQLPEEISLTGYCAVHPSACTRASATFLEIIREGRRFDGLTRIATINRAINQAIAPKTDMELYGVEEFWATPLQTFAMGAGDCEDYAIAKFVALKMLGVAASDLRLLVVRDNAVNDYHAVAAVRHDGHWYILDNRTMALRTDAEIAEFDPLFTLHKDGVRRVDLATARLRQPPKLVMTLSTIGIRTKENH